MFIIVFSSSDDNTTVKQTIGTAVKQTTDTAVKQTTGVTAEKVTKNTTKKEANNLTSDAAKANCERRTMKVLIRRLEETEYFTDAIREELVKFKVEKKVDLPEYEVESVLDYAWCKETVIYFASIL